MARMASSHASTCLGATQASVRLAPVQDSFGSLARSISCHFADSVFPCTIPTFPADSTRWVQWTISLDVGALGSLVSSRQAQEDSI